MHPGAQALSLAVPELWSLIKPQQRGVVSSSVRDFLTETGLTPEAMAELVARRWFDDDGKVREPLAWLRSRGLRIEAEVPDHMREERRQQRVAAVVRAREEMPGADLDAIRQAAATARHRLVQAQKAHALKSVPVADWHCAECETPGRGDPRPDGLCGPCWKATPEGAFADLAARLDA